MRIRPLFVTAVLTALAWANASDAAPNHRLKPGAAGQLCLDCHSDFKDVLKKAFVHTPVKTKDCTGCHSPHASQHGKLLDADAATICARCHAGLTPADAKSAHKPVVENKCQSCHDPHSSNTKFVLAKAGNDVCATCHQKLVEGASSAKFKHAPVQQGCATCHEAHASKVAPSLLKAEQPAACVRCHKMDGPLLVKKHGGYPVATTRCTSCHDPHGSSTRGMLYDNVHSPVARGLCNQCHEPPAGNKFATKQSGVLLCKGCHTDDVNKMSSHNRLHRPTMEGDACLTCHSPHASKEPKLVKGSMDVVCGKCHADSVKRGALSVTPHAPVREAKCTKCHDPHAADQPLMLVRAGIVDLCAGCHDWQKHSSHPVGDKFKDPRNANLRLDCLSCHRAHGTEFKHMMPYATTTDVCTKCHAQYRR